MHRIDTPSATADKKFTDGSPTGGIPATTVSDDWLNDLQETVAVAIEAAGIALSKGNSDQLRMAIVALAMGSVASNFNVSANGGIDINVGSGPTFKIRWLRFSLAAPAGSSQSLVYSSSLTGNIGGSGNGVLFAIAGVINAALDQVGVNNITNSGLTVSKGTSDSIARDGWVLVGGY